MTILSENILKNKINLRDALINLIGFEFKRLSQRPNCTRKVNNSILN